MKKSFLKITGLVLVGCMVLTNLAQAQRYNTAIGGRIGRGLGFTLQQRITDQWTFEAIAFSAIDGSETDFVALGEYHGKIIFQKRLNWYSGVGLHTGSEKDYDNSFGVAFNVGVEATFGRLNFSVDYMPLINFSGGSSVFEAGPAISVRYVLWKRPRKRLFKRRKKERKGIFSR